MTDQHGGTPPLVKDKESDRVRPKLARQGECQQDSSLPYWISAYAIVPPDGQVREVPLEEALGFSTSNARKTTTGDSTVTTIENKDGGGEERNDTVEADRFHHWIDVEIKGNLGPALGPLRKNLLDPLLNQATESQRAVKDYEQRDQKNKNMFLRRHLQNVQQWHTPQVLVMAPLIPDDDDDSGSTDACTFVVMRVLGNRVLVEDSSKTTKRHTHAVRHAVALCLSRTLVTITFSSVSASQKIQSLQVPQDTIRHILLEQYNTPHGLDPTAQSAGLWRWLSFHVGRTAAAAHRLRENLYEMAALDARELQRADIAHSQDVLLRLSAVAEEQNECVQQMAVVITDNDIRSSSSSNNNPCSMRRRMSTARTHAAAAVLQHSTASTERLVFRLQKRVADLDHAYDANQQNRLQRRLNVLTVTSAIFLPLTLLTGIYGMNWSNMPELETEYGYFVFLGAMATLASSLLVIFYRAGWMT